MEGTVTQVDGGYIITFERHLPHSVEKVWSALTEASRIRDWLGGPASSIELRVGGRVVLTGHDRGVESTVLALDPPHLIEYGWKTQDWEGGTIRWELAPEGGGTVLRLTHTMPEVDREVDRQSMIQMGVDPDAFPPIPRTAAGWHTLLDQLQGLLNGDPRLPDDHWRKVFDHYAMAG